MKNEEFWQMMSEIDDDLLLRADECEESAQLPLSRKHNLLKMIPAAACIVLLAAGLSVTILRMPNELPPKLPDGSDITSSDVISNTESSKHQTTPPSRVTSYDPGTDTDTPMEELEVVEWMDSHTLLNGKIELDSLFSTRVEFLPNGPLLNLFDRVYSADDWAEADIDYPLVDKDGTPVIDEETGAQIMWDDFKDAEYQPIDPVTGEHMVKIDEETGEITPVVWTMLGKTAFYGNKIAIYWSMTEAVTLGSYVIYTGNDTTEFPGRQPIGWTLFATNNPELAEVPADIDPSRTSESALDNWDALTDAGWVELDYVYSGEMGDQNSLPFGYKIDEANQGTYKYYCWYIEYGGSVDGVIQINGLKLYEAD